MRYLSILIPLVFLLSGAIMFAQTYASMGDNRVLFYDLCGTLLYFENDRFHLELIGTNRPRAAKKGAAHSGHADGGQGRVERQEAAVLHRRLLVPQHAPLRELLFLCLGREKKAEFETNHGQPPNGNRSNSVPGGPR